MNRILLTLTCALALTTNAASGNTNFYMAAMHQSLGLIKNNHAYLATSQLDWTCLEKTYTERAKKAKNANEILLAFEHLVMEFADNHMMLTTNNNNSYRLYSPVVVSKQEDIFVINDFWKSNLVDNHQLSVGSQILHLNEQTPEALIEAFPTNCMDKTSTKNQTWIINKSLAGVYAKPRSLSYLTNGKVETINLDQLEFKTNQTLVNQVVKDNVGIITINNSLGNTDLIAEFDQSLEYIKHTDGLILDLRNTIGGGDSYMARAIIGRLIEQPKPYQKHRFTEQRGGAVGVSRVWYEYVEPRGEAYTKPLVILSNSWTGSMGEGLTIGLQGMNRATWIGTDMAGLLGAVNQFKLNGLWFSIQMPIQQLFKIDGTPRELARPDIVMRPSSSDNDDILTKAIKHIQQK